MMQLMPLPWPYAIAIVPIWEENLGEGHFIDIEDLIRALALLKGAFDVCIYKGKT